MNWPSKGEIEEAMDVISRHPTPTDLVACALNLTTGRCASMPELSEAMRAKIKRCDFVLHLVDGRIIEVKGNDVL